LAVLHVAAPWHPLAAGHAPAAYEHVPVVVLHLPVPWQPPPLHTTGFDPVHTPLTHVSVCVHGLLSLHPMLPAAGLVQTPVVALHVPATWHWSIFEHTMGLEGVHVPLWHEYVPKHLLVPVHAVLLACATPVSTHTDAPVVQDVTPLWQALEGGVHTRPAVHATQEPVLHTRFVPHDVPSATAIIELVQVATPFVHADTVPLSHGAFWGVHAAPTVHALQTPL
jgi:hypothetical protein